MVAARPLTGERRDVRQQPRACHSPSTSAGRAAGADEPAAEAAARETFEENRPVQFEYQRA